MVVEVSDFFIVWQRSVGGQGRLPIRRRCAGRCATDETATMGSRVSTGPSHAWVYWPRGGPTIRRGRGYLIVRLWPPIFLDYLLSSAAVTLPRDKESLQIRMQGPCRAHTLFLLSIIIDGRFVGSSVPILSPNLECPTRYPPPKKGK